MLFFREQDLQVAPYCIAEATSKRSSKVCKHDAHIYVHTYMHTSVFPIAEATSKKNTKAGHMHTYTYIDTCIDT